MTDQPRTPRLAAPPGTVDTHMHIYDRRFPLVAAGAPFPAVPATVQDYRGLQARLGLARTVVVQPNAYGDDNRCTMEAVSALGEARAIVVVKPDVADAELDRLNRAGARGLRFMTLGGTLGWDVMDGLAARIRPLGWHVQIQLDGRTIAAHADQIARLPVPAVIDHVGKYLEPVPVDHPSFQALLRLVAGGNVWIKLSAPYETSKSGPPLYGDVGALAKALVKAAPERMVWASNWPHPSAPAANLPDDADLLDILFDWAPDDAVRHRILVENPARLYGF